MKILILNGSPHLDGATSDMANAFAEGAREAGNEVVSMNVAHKNIKGCMACEYCRNREKGVCVQKDDMQAIYPEILSADMVVFASPIYYFTLSAQLQTVIHRTYAIDIKITAPHLRLFCRRWGVVLYHAIKAGRLPRQLHLTFMQRFSSVGKKHLVDYQSSSDKAESPSASSTHDGSYFFFFICTLQAGQTWKGFEKEAPQAEQTNSSALKR